MAKLKYDVSNVEDMPDRTPAPVGIYRGKIVKAEGKQSKNNNAMIEVQWRLTHGADGKKLKEEFQDIWDYPILDHDNQFVQNRLKDFISALGLKAKGEIDTDKLVGKSAQLKLKSDTDQDGDYRPRIGKLMGLADDEPADEAEDEEPDEAEDDDDEGVDLDSLSRTELKKLIKEEELDITVKKSMSDDDLRAAIAELLGEDDEEEEEDAEDEDEEEEDTEDEEESDDEEEEEGDNYDDMSVADLKTELKERELSTSGKRALLVARLRKDDEEESF